MTTDYDLDEPQQNGNVAGDATYLLSTAPMVVEVECAPRDLGPRALDLARIIERACRGSGVMYQINLTIPPRRASPWDVSVSRVDRVRELAVGDAGEDPERS